MKRSLLSALLTLSACAQILGLEERDLNVVDSGSMNMDGGNPLLDASLDGQSDAAPIAAPGCAEYCRDAKELCTPEKKVQLFQTDDNCMAVCSKYSTDPSTTGNTLACRLQLLSGLRATGSNEAGNTCPPASPGGGPAPDEPNGTACGTNCQGFCELRSKVCPVMAGDIDCVRKCGALVDDTPFNANADFGSGADTLSCRIAHLSAATYYSTQPGMEKLRDAHCSHSGIRSETQCDFKDDKEIDCKSYCKLVGTACTGDSAIFENPTQCETFCNQLDSGGSKDVTKLATRRCLRNNAYSALESGPQFCAAASAAGDNCEGQRCGSYCELVQKACPDAFAQKYPAGKADCLQECSPLAGSLSNTKFSVTQAEARIGNNLQCRLLRVTQILGGSATAAEQCPAALGLPGSLCN